MSDWEDIKQTTNEQLKHIRAQDDDVSKLVLGPTLTFDPKAETFVGDHAEKANGFLTYKMRKEFAVPEKV